MRRHVALFGHGMGTSVIFAAALGAGALLHLDMPLARRIVVSRVNAVLAPVLEGKITIERVAEIGPTGLTGADVRIEDPEGRRVIRLEGVRARLATLDLVRSLIVGGDIEVVLPELSIARAEVDLEADAGGRLRIARSFVPRRTAETAAAAGRGVRLVLPAARLEHAWLHRGPAPGAPAIDADVDGLRVAIHVAPGTIQVQVPEARAVARGAVGAAAASGSIAASYAQPSPQGGDMAADVVWQGTLGGVAETLRAKYDGGRVEAEADVPPTAPEAIRGLWAASPFTAPVSAHLLARGDLPNVFVSADLSAGPGSVSLAGPVAVGDLPRATIRFEAKAIDARAFATSPETALDASGAVLLAANRDGTFRGVVALEAPRGRVGVVSTPAVSLIGDLEKTLAGARGNGTLRVRETGAPTEIQLQLDAEGPRSTVDFEATTRVPALDGVPRLGPVAHGSATLETRGRIDLGARTVDGRVDLAVADLAVGPVRAGSAGVRARLTGPLEAPVVDARAQAGDLALPGGIRFASLDVGAHGAPNRAALTVALVGQNGKLDAKTVLDLTQGTTLRDTRLAMDGRGEHVAASASLVSVTSAGARADDVVIEGLGAPLRGSFRTSPGGLMVKARTRGLELARIARAAGLARRVGGRVSLDVDAEIRWNAALGRVALDVTDATVDGWEGAKAHVEATLQGRRVTGRASASLGDTAWIDLETKDVEIGGAGPLEPGWWRRTWGEVDVEGKVDLAKLEARLPPEPGCNGCNGSRRISGALALKAQIERDSATDDTPLVNVQASTKGLVVSGVGEGEQAATWKVEGVDAAVDVQVDGRTGHTAIDAQLSDATGLLADFNLASDGVPYGRLFRTSDDPIEIAQAIPFRANLSIPARDIATLPEIAGTRGMHGLFEANLAWEGPLLKPTVTATASLAHGRTDVRLLAMPLDLSFAAQYDGARAHVTLDAKARDNKLVEASADVDARASDLLAHLGPARGEALPWKASATARLAAFPLQSIGALDDRQVRGLASGELTVDGLHDDAKASLELKVDGLRVGDVVCRSAEARASIDGSAFDADASIDQGDGWVGLRSHAASRWGSAPTPSLDPAQPSSASIAAKRFRAELLQPFLAAAFAQLDGRIDADAQLGIDPNRRSIQPRGSLELKDGTFELAQYGGEFHDVAGKVVITPDGVVRLEDATMRGLSGKIQAAATARLDGLNLSGARAEIQVPKNDPLPLFLDGVQSGTIDGRFSVAVDRAADRSLGVTVDVPALHVQLPTSTAHDVQRLGALDGVRVGVKRAGGFVAAPLDGDTGAADKRAPLLPMKIAVKLGGDVQVVRGSDLDVRLSGTPTITVADESRVSGQIRIVRGSVDVQGKPFSIENGTVSFVGDDPTNPQVNLTATWTAPDDTRIFADFIGPLKTAKVTLRSEPSRPKSEILALILFGTVDDQAQTGSGFGKSAQGNAAVGQAGGAATGPLNKALGSVNKVLDNFGLVGGLVTKIDTSNTTPRPEVELQIARDLSVQVAWVLGVPPPGSNPDSTLFTLNWRFLRKWQLETTVGDAGTTILDLVWQRRY